MKKLPIRPPQLAEVSTYTTTEIVQSCLIELPVPTVLQSRIHSLKALKTPDQSAGTAALAQLKRIVRHARLGHRNIGSAECGKTACLLDAPVPFCIWPLQARGRCRPCGQGLGLLNIVRDSKCGCQHHSLHHNTFLYTWCITCLCSSQIMLQLMKVPGIGTPGQALPDLPLKLSQHSRKAHHRADDHAMWMITCKDLCSEKAHWEWRQYFTKHPALLKAPMTSYSDEVW